jgi:hypothetical protein
METANQPPAAAAAAPDEVCRRAPRLDRAAIEGDRPLREAAPGAGGDGDLRLRRALGKVAAAKSSRLWASGPIAVVKSEPILRREVRPSPRALAYVG